MWFSKRFQRQSVFLAVLWGVATLLLTDDVTVRCLSWCIIKTAYHQECFFTDVFVSVGVTVITKLLSLRASLHIQTNEMLKVTPLLTPSAPSFWCWESKIQITHPCLDMK